MPPFDVARATIDYVHTDGALRHIDYAMVMSRYDDVTYACRYH